MCWTKQRGMVPKVCLLLLYLLFLTSPPYPLYQNFISLMYYISSGKKKKKFGSLVSLFTSGMGTLEKLKTITISSSLAANRFLKCCPPSLDQSTEIAWKFWLAPTSSPLNFIVFPFLFECWMSLWKGRNNRKSLEAAFLRHSLSGVCTIQNITFYTCFQFNLLPWL